MSVWERNKNIASVFPLRRERGGGQSSDIALLPGEPRRVCQLNTVPLNAKLHESQSLGGVCAGKCVKWLWRTASLCEEGMKPRIMPP